MDADEPKVPVPKARLATEFLANERTFLAWVRTSIAVITLGFLVAKFGIWLRELATQVAPQSQAAHTPTSLYVGMAMMIAGGGLTVLAARRYHVVNRAIERGQVSPDRALVYLVMGVVSLLSVALIGYVVMTA